MQGARATAPPAVGERTISSHVSYKPTSFEDWERFTGGEASFRPKTVDQAVLSSWERCRTYGIDPETVGFNFVSPDELQARRKANAKLVDAAVPYVENLHQIIRGSGAIITLSDAQNVIVHVVSDLQSRHIKNFPKLGTDQSERLGGTNGIGTALAARQPVQIVGFDHWFRNNHDWACYAAPIQIDGKIIGALDLTIPIENRNPLSLGLVVSGVNGIERELRLTNALSEREILVEQQNAVLSMIDTGFILVDRDGIVKDTNAELHRIFHDTRSWNNHPLDDFFQTGVRFGDALDAAQNFELREKRAKIRRHPVALHLSCNLIRTDDRAVGAVFSVRESQSLHRIINKVAGPAAAYTFDDMVGAAPRFRACLEQAKMAAHIDTPVLIAGEQGTGKEVLAQAIHNASSRRDYPFVAINCTTMLREALRAELFGTEGMPDGTGARPGKFELADGGSVFLDSIEDLPPDAQVNVLHVLQSGTVTRVGGYDARSINVRILASTGADLDEAVACDRFRRDLLYRLNVFSIAPPALRERLLDIPELAMIVLASVGAPGIDLQFSAVALTAMSKYHWPGNIRELENVVERAYFQWKAKNPDGENGLIGLEFLPGNIAIATQGNAPVEHAAESSVKEIRKVLLMRLLREKRGNLRQVALAMRVSRSTVYNLIKSHAIDVTQFR